MVDRGERTVFHRFPTKSLALQDLISTLRLTRRDCYLFADLARRLGPDACIQAVISRQPVAVWQSDESLPASW